MDCIQSLGSDPQPVFSFRGPYRSEANSNCQCLPMSTFNSRKKDDSRFAWSPSASWVTIDATLTETHQKLVVDVNRFLAVFEARSTELDAIRALSWGHHKIEDRLVRVLGYDPRSVSQRSMQAPEANELFPSDKIRSYDVAKMYPEWNAYLLACISISNMGSVRSPEPTCPHLGAESAAGTLSARFCAEF